MMEEAVGILWFLAICTSVDSGTQEIEDNMQNPDKDKKPNSKPESVDTKEKVAQPTDNKKPAVKALQDKK